MKILLSTLLIYYKLHFICGGYNEIIFKKISNNSKKRYIGHKYNNSNTATKKNNYSKYQFIRYQTWRIDYVYKLYGKPIKQLE